MAVIPSTKQAFPFPSRDAHNAASTTTPHNAIPITTQGSFSLSEAINLADLKLPTTCNNLRIKSDGKNITMPGATSYQRLHNVSLNIVGNDHTGYDLEISTNTEKENANTEQDKTLTFELADGASIEITHAQAKTLGKITHDLIENCEATENDNNIFTLENTSLQTFSNYLDLCSNTRRSQDAIRPINAVALLKLADFLGNKRALQMCKFWVFQNMGVHLASTNKPLLQQRLLSLTELPYTLWADTETTHHGNTVIKPGLLKQVLCMAFPSTPLKDRSLDNRKFSIEKMYNDIAALQGKTPSETKKLIQMPQIHQSYSTVRSDLVRSIKCNAIDALTSCLNRTENLTNNGVFKEIEKRKALDPFRPSRYNHHEKSNILCNAIEAALPKTPGQTTHYECLELLLDTITTVCGPTVVADTLNSSRGLTLLNITAQANDFRALKMLIDAGAKGKNTGCLGEFAQNGNHEAIELLLSHGANPNEDFAILEAITHNQAATFESLLNAGAQLSGALYHQTKSPINLAAATGNIALINRLIDMGCAVDDIHQQEKLGTRTTEEYIMDNGRPYTYRVHRNVRINDYETPLLAALRKGQTETAIHLITQGADLNQPVRRKNALEAAVQGDCTSPSQTSNMRHLIEHHPSFIESTTPDVAAKCLRLAARSQQHELLELLLTQPVFSNKKVLRLKSENGKTAYQLYRKNEGARKDILKRLSTSPLPPFRK